MIDKNATVKQQVKSKINWLGTAVLIAGFVQANIDSLAPFVGEYLGLVNIGLGVLIIVARQVTTGAVSEK